MGIPQPDAWNAAVEHSHANPAHILGPYEDDNGIMHMECMGDGDPYEQSNCDFDTAKIEQPRNHGSRIAPGHGPVMFRRDFSELPAFRQTIRIRGWNGLHMRAAARVMQAAP